MMPSFVVKGSEFFASAGSVSLVLAVPVVGLFAVCLFAYAEAKRLTHRPALTYQKTRFNESVLSRMPTLRSLYKPLPFLTNGHVETIFAAKARSKVDVTYRRETLHMPDGGIVALDWRVPNEGDVVRSTASGHFRKPRPKISSHVFTATIFKYLRNLRIFIGELVRSRLRSHVLEMLGPIPRGAHAATSGRFTHSHLPARPYRR
jgi:hypothetical protein